MKITILNQSQLTNTHIKLLRRIGDVVEYNNTVGESKAIKRLKDSEIAIADCENIPFTRKVFQALPSLKFLCLNSTGYEKVDIKAANEFGIIISNIPNYSTDSVAEHTIALLFSLAKKIPLIHKKMLFKPFEIEPSNKKHNKYLAHSIRGKNLGIIGLGNIGYRVAELAKALGMNVFSTKQFNNLTPWIIETHIDELFKTSDFISINSSYRSELGALINKESISKMKTNCIIVNTARGGLVDEQALAKALKSNKIAGYATDVLYEKTRNNPLLKINNVILTPHMGFFTEESLNKMAEIILRNVELYITGNPQNIIK